MLFLRIATLNVRGMSETAKQLAVHEFLNEKNVHVMKYGYYE